LTLYVGDKILKFDSAIAATLTSAMFITVAAKINGALLREETMGSS